MTSPPKAAPPAGTTATLVMQRNSDGAYEFYDIGHRTILLDGPLGAISPALQVAGVGGFDGADTADLLMRNSTTGVFTLYDSQQQQHHRQRCGGAGRPGVVD